MHIYDSMNKAIIGLGISFLPVGLQAIILTNADLFLIRLLPTHFSEIIDKHCNFHARKSNSKCSMQNGGHFVLASIR